MTGEVLKTLFVGLATLCGLASFVAVGNAQDATAIFKALRLDGHFVKWQKSSTDPEITYQVATTPREFAGARNCRGMTALDSLLVGSEIAVATFERELAAAFAMWEAVAGLKFRQARLGEPAEIIIGAQLDPEGWAFADVFYDAASPQHVKPILQALICFNPLRRWKVGFDGNLKAYDLRYTLAHEIGHAIGLDHPPGPGQIMNYRYEERFRDLQSGDVFGAVALYGAPTRGTVAGFEREVDLRPAVKRGGTRAVEHATEP
jgi:hypothetical protein